MPEILAPAGGAQALTAAVRCGANAVYLGAQGFNARRGAENFDADGLKNAVAYCHGRGVRVYVTVNTLAADDEMSDLERTAELTAQSGADAVILQDMAALRLFSGRYPSLGRIASTQTAVHNADGAKRLRDMGFDTVVLARELSLSEMESICRQAGVKTEAFVHGAHCMSLSGACYLSAMLGGRSGNRGMCAQPCRLDWRCGDKDHVLSLKDMSLVDHLRELASAGVDAFKIEGRMKRPEYVAAAVTACRRSLAGEAYDADALRAVFSRSGFTDGYLTGRRDGQMFGYRTRQDVEGAEGVLRTLAGLYRNETPLVPVSMDFRAYAGGSRLTVSDGENTFTLTGAVPEPAKNRPLTPEAAVESLKKTGGTPFYTRQTAAAVEPGLTMSAAAVNALRRQALDALLEKRQTVTPHPAQPWTPGPAAPHSPAHSTALWARFSAPEQVVLPKRFERLLLPVHTITKAELTLYGEKLCAQLPALLFEEDDPALDERLQTLRDEGLREIWTDNVYGLELASRLGLSVRGGFGLNILNTEALRHYAQQGLLSVTVSFELSMARIRALGDALPRGAVVYGRLPLMRFRACPVQAAVGCAACAQKGSLTDRLGVEFPVECCERRFSTLLNSVPLHIAEKPWEGLDYGLLYFTREDPERCRAVTRAFLERRRSGEPRTGGLYYRELL